MRGVIGFEVKLSFPNEGERNGRVSEALER
jgi:hypothetical protein